MPTVKISDQAIFYAVRGNEFIRSNAPLVFIHGAGDSHLVWNGQLAAFGNRANKFAATSIQGVPADTGRAVIALDLPGHGRSTGAGRTTVLDYAVAVREFLDALDIPQAVLVGISMGGAIAQMMALEFPERVAALGLVATGAKLRVAPQFLEGLRTDFEGTARVLVESYFASNLTPQPPLLKREGEMEVLKEKSLQQLLATGSAVAYGDFAACDGFDVRERISTIGCPTLVVCGREDKMTPVKYSEFLAERIPGARLVVIEGAGHMVMMEKAGEFEGVVREWLSE